MYNYYYHLNNLRQRDLRLVETYNWKDFLSEKRFECETDFGDPVIAVCTLSFPPPVGIRIIAKAINKRTNSMPSPFWAPPPFIKKAILPLDLKHDAKEFGSSNQRCNGGKKAGQNQ